MFSSSHYFKEEGLDSQLDLSLNVFRLKTNVLVHQARATLSGLDNQTAIIVKPYIDELGSAILNGRLKIECFTKETPFINERMKKLVESFKSNVSHAFSTREAAMIEYLKVFEDTLPRIHYFARSHRYSEVSKNYIISLFFT